MALQKVRWGVISTAKIGRTKVIPGIQKSKLCEVRAISSRDQKNAEKVAGQLGIPKAYGSYEDLLADPEIDAVYNPLPNHLHVEWTVKAMNAGKHVLCEKPIGLDAAEAQTLLDKSKKHPDLKVMEAFMYRFHPQWQYVKNLVQTGAIGEVKVIQSFFSYFNIDPHNVRNMADIGGGGLMDIGCYCISFPRFLFEEEPRRVVGLMDFDPNFNTDRIASGILDFSNGKSSLFTCSTQLTPFQRCIAVGSEGSIEIEIPVNAPIDVATRIHLKTRQESKTITFDPADQYTLQAQAFAEAILNNTEVPTPLEDALGNMKVIDAIVESARDGRWALL